MRPREMRTAHALTLSRLGPRPEMPSELFLVLLVPVSVPLLFNCASSDLLKIFSFVFSSVIGFLILLARPPIP